MFGSIRRAPAPLRGALIFFIAITFVFAMAGSALGQGNAIKLVVFAQTLGTQSGRYVAGKDAAVLVVLNQPTAVDPATQQAVITRDGTTVATLTPSPSAGPVVLLTFLCPDRAACGDWQAGDYSVQVKVGDSTAQATAKFQERQGIRVLALPVKAPYGTEVRAPTGIWKTMGDFTRQVYPVAPSKFQWIIGQELDASDPKFNVQTQEGQFEVWKAVRMLQPPVCHETPRPADANCYDQIYGFIKDPIALDGGMLLGFTRGEGINIGGENLPGENGPATVAHEIGHNFKLGDEYNSGQFNCNANPPPATYVGRDFNDREKSNFSCTASKSAEPPEGSSSMIIGPSELAFEVGGRGLLQTALLSFMGNGVPMQFYWITPDAWKQIFDELDPAKKKAAASIKVAAPLNATATRWIVAYGSISTDDKVNLEPWWDFSDTHDHKDRTGSPYTIRAVDAQGKTLTSDALAINFIVPDNAPLKEAPFEVALPFPENTAAFQILKGDKVINETKVSANAPTVKVNAPVTGDTITTATASIKWEASDIDGDKLFYIVSYSPDGDNWIILQANLNKTELVEDFTTLPGTGKATSRFSVIATDGINSTEAISGLFTVPPKAPLVDIEEPDANITVASGIDVILKGAGYDYQDGWIEDDNALVWSSDLQGDLGKGEQVVVRNLKLGKHTITFKATNSYKLTGTGTVTITVAEPGKVPTATPVPVLSTRTPTPTVTGTPKP